MSVSFPQIPAAGQLRVPGFYIDMDPSRAGSPVIGASPVLFIGNMITTGGGAGTATPGVLTRVFSDTQAPILFGPGSQLSEAIIAWRQNNLTAEMWAVAFEDAVAGIAQKYTLTYAGTATGDGTIHLMIGGRDLKAPVLTGDDQDDVAASVAAAVLADSGMSVSAAAVLAEVTTTSKHAADFTAQIDHRHNHRGPEGGEEFPPGITVVVASTVTGANDPDISSIGGIIGSLRFDFVSHPYKSTIVLDDIETLHNHVTGRWAWLNQAYGHAVGAARGTPGTLTTLGNSRNDPHNVILGQEPIPSQPWQVAAAAFGAAYTRLSSDPGQPETGLRLQGIVAAKIADRFTFLERNALLFDGIATVFTDDAGAVRIERLISTFQLDDFNAPSDAFLDTQTLFQSMFFNRGFRALYPNKLADRKLVADGAFIATGSKTVDVTMVRGIFVAEYSRQARLGIVEKPELFADNLILVRPEADPNRLDAVLRPDYVNQVRVLAALNQFALELTAEAA